MATYVITRLYLLWQWNQTSILYSTLREPSVNRKDLQALRLEGPLRDNPELDPLAELHLDNWL